MTDISNQKSLFVTFCGAPNVGKSTLTNAFVGTKVTITSPRPQTTRFAIRGIAMFGETQIVFLDTPGIFNPRGKRQQKMVDSAFSGLDEGELLMLLIDANKGIDANTEKVIESLVKQNKKCSVIINKVDLVEKIKVAELAQKLAPYEIFEEIFMISALKHKNMEALKEYMISRAAVQAWAYPEDQLSDINDRIMAEEITREKIFYLLREELPYGVEVITEAYKEMPNKISIHQQILVPRDSHKKIIIGEKAELLKRIGQSSRRELTEMFGKPTDLFLHVKVDKNLDTQ
jgi:GTP-binding protein Era